MNLCPHCGAELRDNARFCAQCMTSLDHKRVVPTPKYLPIRWLSAAAAVFVLCGAVGGGWIAARQMAQEDHLPVAMPTTQTAAPSTTVPTTATDAPTTTTDPPTTLTGAPSTTLTTLSEWFSTSMENTTTTTKKTTTYPNPTYATIPTAPTTPPYTTTARTTTSSTTAPKTTYSTTTTKTTTTTAPAPTYPASWDEGRVFYNPYGEAYEDVGWTYKAAGNSMYVDNAGFGEYTTFTKTYRYNIPLSECIVVTGFKKIASNGCYRIPPTIDGKVVVAVDMRTAVAGAHQFNDEDVALTVREIAFPPELLLICRYTFDQCKGIERAYFTSAYLLMYPEAVPTDTGVGYGGALSMYGNSYMLYDPYGNAFANKYQLKQYCENIVNPGVCITLGSRKRYGNTYWWPMPDTYNFNGFDLDDIYPDWWSYVS